MKLGIRFIRRVERVKRRWGSKVRKEWGRKGARKFGRGKKLNTTGIWGEAGASGRRGRKN